MTVNKLRASFGKLEGETLELGEGMNVIVAPNESGKSTWCAFIRAMLYGVDSSERARGGTLPDKTRYLPWSGKSMEGELELSCGGRDITLIRTTRLKSAPMREFSAVYSGTNIPVEGLNSGNAGEKLLGISKDVFNKTAFVGQGAVAISGSAELEKRISSIVTSGDEEISYTEAADRLKAWQRLRRHNRRGKIPETEEKILGIRRRISEAESITAESERLKAELETKTRLHDELKEAVTEGKKQARKDFLSDFKRLREEKEAVQAKFDAAESRRNACVDELYASSLGAISAEEAEARISADREESRELHRLSERKTSILSVLIVMLLSIVISISALTFLKELLTPLITVSTVLMLSALPITRIQIKKKNESSSAAARLKMLLDKYNIDDESGFELILRSHLALCEALDEARADCAEARARLEMKNLEYDSMSRRSLTELNFEDDGETARLSRERDALQRDCEATRARISELKGRASAIGEVSLLYSELGCSELELSELNSEYEAIELALSVLSEADTDIQSRFSPELGRLASEYMELMTEGKYKELHINRDFTALTKTEGDTVRRETGYLSAGALDLMYLAVRLAVCTLALPEGESCPLILDDTLVNLDEKRTQAAMKLLEKLSETRQVILFSCKKP